MPYDRHLVLALRGAVPQTERPDLKTSFFIGLSRRTKFLQRGRTPRGVEGNPRQGRRLPPIKHLAFHRVRGQRLRTLTGCARNRAQMREGQATPAEPTTPRSKIKIKIAHFSLFRRPLQNAAALPLKLSYGQQGVHGRAGAGRGRGGGERIEQLGLASRQAARPRQLDEVGSFYEALIMVNGVRCGVLASKKAVDRPSQIGPLAGQTSAANSWCIPA